MSATTPIAGTALGGTPALSLRRTVEPPWFCDREAESDLLAARVRGATHVFVLSPRRYGKTSLVRRAIDLVQVGGGSCACANLLVATNEVELAAVIPGPAEVARPRVRHARPSVR